MILLLTRNIFLQKGYWKQCQWLWVQVENKKYNLNLLENSRKIMIEEKKWLSKRLH